MSGNDRMVARVMFFKPGARRAGGGHEYFGAYLMKPIQYALAVASLITVTSPTFSQDNLAGIRAEIDAIRSDYQSRIANLEARLAIAEARAEDAANIAQSVQSVIALAPPVAAPPPARYQNAPANNSFNPAISVVLNGQYVSSSQSPDTAGIPGFQLDEEAGRPDRGFGLGESEVVLSANIDPTLFGNLIFALSPEGSVEVEEAYIQSTGLGGGVTIRAGRMFSGVGYLNEVHAHNWSFSDQPLPYRAFFGGQFGDDGVQARWVAPLDQYLEFGAEIYRGDSFPAYGSANEGTGTSAVWVRSGGDLSVSSSWLASASYMSAEADNRNIDGEIFTGEEALGIMSLVYKWAPGGNRLERNLTLSAELFLNSMDGNFNAVPINLDRSGWYVQGVYQFQRQWSAGLRYAALDSADTPMALNGSALDGMGFNPRAVTALLEYDTSEFGRLRAQFTHDETDLNSNDEFRLQYTVTYGPHGAHRY